MKFIRTHERSHSLKSSRLLKWFNLFKWFNLLKPRLPCTSGSDPRLKHRAPPRHLWLKHREDPDGSWFQGTLRRVLSLHTGNPPTGPGFNTGNLPTHLWLKHSKPSVSASRCPCQSRPSLERCGRGNVASAVVSIASRSRKLGEKLRMFFLTRPSPRPSGPEQPTPLRELPAAALTAFVATLPPPWFPLPPGLENQGENCERQFFFFDEAVAKTFWPRSADFDAEASCSCLDSLRSNVAGAVVSIASRYRKSGENCERLFFF